VVLSVTHAPEQGLRIREDKGVNFPDITIPGPALTKDDLANLDFILEHGDIVSCSFVQSADDVWQIKNELNSRYARITPLILKVETATAVKNLPDILVAASGTRPVGVMIARGDLAVELGPARMAEIQEEILWLCEAAHIPVVWATQVLDTMARRGTSARAEITDAAMSARAECVMLNKGPYIVEAVQLLSEILTRMEAHQDKKFSKLRALHW
jgi:pyruvate kinase